jgi:hypothetical protein
MSLNFNKRVYSIYIYYDCEILGFSSTYLVFFICSFLPLSCFIIIIIIIIITCLFHASGFLLNVNMNNWANKV